ncbi:MAG: malate dehydrogenase [bacterium]|nr:malate dehydrogenase [bacterium]MDE0644480.1 malate dehydrogenase [bacterium]
MSSRKPKKVTIVGAGKYGSTTAQRLAAQDIVDEVVLTDIVEGLPQGLALDMNQSRPVEGYRTRVVGTNGYDETAGSEVGIITAGLARRPGMSRMDLLAVNARIVRTVTRELVERSPDITLIVVTNPLDQMTVLAAQVSGLPKTRVMGQAGILDSSRFAHFIAERLGTDILEVKAMTLGSHGETMVPAPSQCSVGGVPLTDLLSAEEIDDLVEQTRNGGAEIVAFLKTGSAYFAPSSAAAIMARSILNDESMVVPVCAWLSGEYGLSDVYLGVPARLGASGVEKIVELDLTESERAGLHAAAAKVVEKVEEMEQILEGVEYPA